MHYQKHKLRALHRLWEARSFRLKFWVHEGLACGSTEWLARLACYEAEGWQVDVAKYSAF